MNDDPVPIYGDGTQIREWIYVKDHCNAILSVLENGKIGEIYNIGTNCEITNIDLTKKILKIMNKKDDLIKYVDDRLGHDKRYALNSSKIRKELEWKPTVGFEDGIKKTIEWYKKYFSLEN